VNPQDPLAIARAIDIYHSRPEAEAMGQRGRQAACKLYNWESEERSA